MYPDDLIRIQHMLDYAERAMRYAEGRQRPDLDDNDILALALTRCVEIIGEAASQVTHNFREGHPDVPWTELVGMRNRLIHAYVDVNLNILWATVTEDLPQLVPVLRSIAQSSGVG
ncbi:MAG: HepT-like ribonuclease domain-containing protein [Chloroflexota bacterium]